MAKQKHDIICIGRLPTVIFLVRGWVDGNGI